MNVHLDWQAADENGNWETVAVIGGHRGHRMPWRALSVLLAVLVISGVGVWFTLKHRYYKALYQATIQIQDVIDLETRALNRGELDLYLAQQDETSPAWFARQARHAHTRCPPHGDGTLDLLLSLDILPQPCSPIPATRVQSMDLLGDIAWVEVLSQDGIRRLRFYRRTDLGWKHTAPDRSFWNDPAERTYGPVTVRCHERDLAYVRPLVDHIAATYSDLCTMLGCPPDATLDVSFVPVDRPPRLSGHTLVIASPLLSGISVESQWDDAYLDNLTYWVAYEIMSRLVRPMDAEPLDWSQRAVLGEYAALYVRGQITPDPILRDVIDRCEASLPAAFRAAMVGPPLPEAQ